MDARAKAIAMVAVTSLDAAADFYGQTLGLPLVDERPFALVVAVNGTMLRISEVPSVTLAAHTVLGFDVPDIDASVAELHARGIDFTHYAGMGQDASGIWTAPNGDRVAWFPDPDGNNLSLTQFI